MGAIKDIIEAIEVRMDVLGFTQTDDVFDFKTVPQSRINKAFRLETRTRSNDYYPGDVSNVKETIEIWIAYKAKRNRRTVWKTGLDDRESIEVDLINAAGISGLSCDPLLIMDQEAGSQKELPNHIISKLVFTADYIRDVSPA